MVKIVLGVVLGITVAGLLGFAVRMYFVSQAMAQDNNGILEISAQSQRSMQMHQERSAAMHKAALEQASRQHAEAAAMLREGQMLKQQAVEAAARKEEAWRRYYQTPALCASAEGQAFVECANGFIRAKRAFELKYATGPV